ncbi:ABC transporter, phosphonate, periplasmic substrate-binding protein [compost metagenome]
MLNKQVDVAVNNTENMERYRINTGKNPFDQVRVLWKSPLIPADPMVYRKDLSPDLKKKIQTFFVNYGKGADAAREKQVLAALTYQGFRPSTDAQLVPIRQIELAREKAKIETDTTLAAADKDKRLADVSRRLAELDKAAAATAAQ